MIQHNTINCQFNYVCIQKSVVPVLLVYVEFGVFIKTFSTEAEVACRKKAGTRRPAERHSSSSASVCQRLESEKGNSAVPCLKCYIQACKQHIGLGEPSRSKPVPYYLPGPLELQVIRNA